MDDTKDPTGMVNIPPVGANPTPTASASPNLPGDKTPTPKASTNPQVSGQGMNAAVVDINRLTPFYNTTTKRWEVGYVDSTGALQYAAVLADPNSPSGYSVYTDRTAVHNKAIQDLIKQYGSIQETKKQLWAKGLYTVAGYKTKASIDFGDTPDNAFNDTIDAITGSLSYKNLLDKGQNVQSVAGWIDGRPNYAGTRSTTTTTFTSKQSAWTDLEAFYREELGRVPTIKEFDDYYQSLTSFEKQNPVKATVTTDQLGMERNRTQISGPSQDDIKALMVASASQAIMAAGKDPAAISQLGGTVGTNIMKLKQHAADLGVSDIFGADKIVTSAFAATQPGGKLENEFTKINQLASALPKYKAYAPLFAQGFTLRDVATPVNDIINKEYGTSKPVDLSSPLLMQALTGGANGTQMNDQQISQLVRSQPDWAKSSVAKEEAAAYINQIGRMMGFIA